MSEQNHTPMSVAEAEAALAPLEAAVRAGREAQQTGDRTAGELASLAVNAGRALQDEKRHYEIACQENDLLRAAVERGRKLALTLDLVGEAKTADQIRTALDLDEPAVSAPPADQNLRDRIEGQGVPIELRDLPREVRLLVHAVDRIRSDWAESSEERRNELWRGVHEASDAVWHRPLAALPAPADRATAAELSAEVNDLRDELNAATSKWVQLEQDRTGTWEDAAQWAPGATADRAEVEAHRLALSQALGLGTGAPWDAIRERAAGVHQRAADQAAVRAAALHWAADQAYRRARHLDEQEHDERAQGAWDVENVIRAELRRLADEQPTTPTGGEAWPPLHRWRVETFDGEWSPGGTRYPDRADAAARFHDAFRKAPAWQDGTPVERRIVRETTTYTVEPEPAGPAAPAKETQPTAGKPQDQTAISESAEPRPCRTFVSGGTVWCCEEGETDCPCVCHLSAADAAPAKEA